MPGAHEWILLLQIDSAKDFACWGDWGSLYFWITVDVPQTRGR
jgi:uncharacterized protein YwqG